MEKPAATSASEDLRERAEQALRRSEADLGKMPFDDLKALIHDFQVHQIELQIQNEELLSTQLQLQDSRDRYTELYEYLPVGYLTLDRDGVICVANPMAGTIFAIESSDLIGTKISQHVDPRDQDILYRTFRHLLADDRKHSCELRILGKDGVVWTQFEGHAHATNADEWLITLTDISERKRAEERLRDQESKFAHVARLNCIGEMVAGIAHEINQPLQAIASYSSSCELELARHGSDHQEKLHEILGQITGQAFHAGEILKRLRVFLSKSESDRSLVSLNDIITESVQLIELEARRHDATVRLMLDGDLPAVSGDAVQLQQVVVNLLRNAFEAVQTRNAHTVVVRTHAANDRVEVAIEDEGNGVSTEIAEKMFEGFFSTKQEGMGLGLAISRSIIDSHGGMIWATPNRGQGTTLHFFIPIATDASVL